eukprot:scaffold12959_cov28-Tisochrysis_lutea.AAC.4
MASKASVGRGRVGQGLSPGLHCHHCHCPLSCALAGPLGALRGPLGAAGQGARMATRRKDDEGRGRWAAEPEPDSGPAGLGSNGTRTLPVPCPREVEVEACRRRDRREQLSASASAPAAWACPVGSSWRLRGLREAYGRGEPSARASSLKLQQLFLTEPLSRARGEKAQGRRRERKVSGRGYDIPEQGRARGENITPSTTKKFLPLCAVSSTSWVSSSSRACATP